MIYPSCEGISFISFFTFACQFSIDIWAICIFTTFGTRIDLRTFYFGITFIISVTFANFSTVLPVLDARGILDTLWTRTSVGTFDEAISNVTVETITSFFVSLNDIPFIYRRRFKLDTFQEWFSLIFKFFR